MSNKITGKVLAIQLGREETRIVLLGGGGEIQHAIAMPTTAGAVDDGVIRSPEAVRAMLKKALDEPEFKKVRQAVFSLCTSQIITETVTVPDLPAARLEKLLRANADMYFPVDTQEYNLVWQAIEQKQGDGGQKELAVQLWAIPNAMLRPYYSVANSCGLSVLAIDYCGHSMATVAGASFAAPGSKDTKKSKKQTQTAPVYANSGDTTLHLLLDQELLGMTFVKNGRVVMQRSVRCGSDPTYQFGELAMMLEYYRSMEGGWDAAINGIAYGSHAGNDSMLAELADMLGIPVVKMDAPYDPSLALCVGAAQTDLDFGIPSLNVAGKARREVQSQLWQYALLLCGGLVLVAVVLFTLSSQLNWNSKLAALEAENQTVTIQYGQVADYSKNYENYQSLYNAYSGDWDDIFNNLQTYNNNLVLVMEELEEILPDQTSVVGFNIQPTGLNVTFAADSKEEAAYLMMALREMEYAQLMEISDLQGGGAGPAESYGSGKSEKAPKEGSSSKDLSEAQREALTDALAEDLNAYALAYNLGMGWGTTDRMENLKNAYSGYARNKILTMEELKEEAGDDLTREVRANAFKALCTTNVFAMYAAESVIREDYTSGGSLGPYIERELEKRDSSIISVYMHRSVQDLQSDIEILVDIIVTPNSSYDALAEAEKILCKDENMEAWYLYYLEAELEEEDSSFELPCLNMDVVISDVLDGEFNSRYAGLNGVLNKLLSTSTKNLVKQINEELNAPKPTDPTEPTDPNAPTEPTQPTEPTEPTQPTDPTEPEETEPDEGGEDIEIPPSLFLEMLLEYYIETGKIPMGGDMYMDLVEAYFAQGGTGTEIDRVANAFIASGKADVLMEEVMKIYAENPEMLNNEALRQMLENYYTNGTTGNEILNDWIKRAEEALKKWEENQPTEPEETEPTEPTDPSEPSDPTDPSEPSDPTDPTEPSEPDVEAPDDTLKGWLMMFLYYGTTGEKEDANNNQVPDADEMIAMYLLSSSGMKDQDTRKKLDTYVSNGDVDQFLVRQLNNYLYNKSAVPNATIVTMFDNYYKGTTGNVILDQRIKLAREAVADAALKDAMNQGGGGSGGGQAAGPVDNRIFFAVILNYKEELKNAELNRKGLDYDDKIKRLEVEE